ncbi:B3/4 domain protein [Pyrolobus fumarii 1A]|uniref:B3/4 domain protein n=1 Tax=Pyrolobus fumarii (strain DSM 11204 / 1A) TaxID=694429 RepID=G0EDI7_PYRF1|nr:phenylalanine--tRNA ligase beta subunit-related protein [Pyrolobus fumarii]AEM38672.1 B3/4 domain protein [Pyrolobus fumarii 1A]
MAGRYEGIVRVEPEASSLGIYVYYGVVIGVHVEASPAELLQEFDRVAEELKQVYGRPEELSRDPVIQAYRKFYWRIGIDPTKTRPAGEALARRLLRGRGLPSINNVVDAGNVVSARLFVPIGIYDLDKFEPPARITLSRGGEVFRPIGGRGEEKLKPGIPIMVDAKGVVMHLYPHRDSIDTCVKDETRSVLVVAAGVEGVPRERVEKAARDTLNLIERYAGGEAHGVWRSP